VKSLNNVDVIVKSEYSLHTYAYEKYKIFFNRDGPEGPRAYPLNSIGIHFTCRDMKKKNSK
jgi:hypothetical protein